jgi:predicted MPP superfamily phosphohydrolase
MLIVRLVVLATLLFAVLAAVRALVWLAARAQGRDARQPWVVVGDRVLGGLTAVGLGLYAYGHWVEPRRVEVTRVDVPLRQLPAGATGVRVVHVSDVHTPTNRWLQRQLPARVAALRPDVIVFTGDGVNSRADVAEFRATMRLLARVAPTYAVHGNTDAAAMPADTGLFDGTGAHELRGTREHVSVRGVRLALVGASRAGDWRRVHHSLRSDADGLPSIYVAHSPDVSDDVARWGAALILAGHTHGGQVALPWYGALWTGSRHGKRFESGRSRVGESWLYVNRGIGMERLLPEVRLLARPEITVLELRPAAGPAPAAVTTR